MTVARPRDPEPGERLHSGRLAHLAAAALGAHAFVVGRTIFLSRPAAREVASGSTEGRKLLAHERAHVEQYRRNGVAWFLLRYCSDYLRARVRGRSHAEAYAAIGFECEARASEAAALSPEGCPGGPPRGA